MKINQNLNKRKRLYTPWKGAKKNFTHTALVTAS